MPVTYTELQNPDWNSAVSTIMMVLQTRKKDCCTCWSDPSIAVIRDAETITTAHIFTVHSQTAPSCPIGSLIVLILDSFHSRKLCPFWKMVSSGILRRAALVRTEVSEELSASFIMVRRLLVTASVVPTSPILVTLMKEALSSSETSILTRVTQRNIPEYTILHSHRRVNFKTYILPILSV
jgi:hypothetical protein